MGNQYPQIWDLDVIYPGGSASAAFAAELAGMENDIKQLQTLISDKDGEQGAKLGQLTALSQRILLALRQSESYVSCLAAQNTKDAAASVLNDRVKTIAARYTSAMTQYDTFLRGIGDKDWETLLGNSEHADISFNLQERRELAKRKMAPELEALAGDLAINGYHGWGDFYDTLVAATQFRVEENGETKSLSAGQMYNRLSDEDREVRQAAFAEWEREWTSFERLGAETLNRLAGFRLKLYENRGWNDVLQEPLQINRMTQKTLNAMWGAIGDGKTALVSYLQRKASLLGLEKLDWHDVEAPLGASSKKLTYDESAAFIIEQFRSFDPRLAEFAEMTFKEGWIEAEDRAGKRPGGFCTSFPKSGQTRIFMTFSGSSSTIMTLAHELGHAYHQHVMNDKPAFAQEYAMNVAETASTFAEMIVSDRALSAAEDGEEKLGLLEGKIQNAVAFFMNIHARLLFETRFYEKRKQGLVTADELNALMAEAQREAYCDTLGELHPHFWLSKLHFYITDVPFYNFPYTFGYLFSAGLYARALEQGAEFADQYVALLRDTGSMTVEELAMKHLGVDLEQPEFWQAAVALTERDVQQFLDMTK
jgi:pepF/M3 family oligoendopeptidase